MITYVLGAGASLHAGYPLTAQLGGILLDWMRTGDVSNSDFRIRAEQVLGLYAHPVNFEHILTDLESPAPSSPIASLTPSDLGNLRHDLRWALREYFDSLRLHRALLYERLVRQRIQGGDTVITFNYDLAIERALKAADLWEVGDGYGFPIEIPHLSHSRVIVLKLHGSTDWLAMIMRGSRGFQMCSNSLGSRPVIYFWHDLEFLGYPSTTRDLECAAVQSAALVPILIMPTLRKRFYFETTFGRELEGFMRALWESAQDALACSSEIVIIGYSLPEADDRARDLLLKASNRSARVTVCCGSRSEAIRHLFLQQGFASARVEITPGEHHFREFLDG
jgi:hypothetical protein